ncbi:MAG: class I SAM-dependent methyltransferase [Humibacillus sp.]
MTQPDLTSPHKVAAQYAVPTRLETRRSVWGPGPEGVSPVEVLRLAVLDENPSRVLEVGCGTGELACVLVAALPDVHLVATDLSAGMVAATRGRAVHALVAPADRLPFGATTFEVVVAAWMLYHVPDLHAALGELRRVLRPDGVLLVATNGERHLAELMADAGSGPLLTQFTSEAAPGLLEAHFGTVTRRDVETRATFDDHAAAVGYLASFDEQLAQALPPFDGSRSYAGHASVLTARGPRRSRRD